MAAGHLSSIQSASELRQVCYQTKAAACLSEMAVEIPNWETRKAMQLVLVDRSGAASSDFEELAEGTERRELDAGSWPAEKDRAPRQISRASLRVPRRHLAMDVVGRACSDRSTTRPSCSP